MTETIRVDKVVDGKFGEQAMAGNAYYSYGKFFKGDKLMQGQAAEVEIYVTAKGNKYINKVVSLLSTPADAVVSTPVEVPVKRGRKAAVVDAPKAVDNTMSKADWQAKDNRISRQGVIQAAVQAVSSHSQDLETLFVNAEMLANKMLEYVNS